MATLRPCSFPGVGSPSGNLSVWGPLSPGANSFKQSLFFRGKTAAGGGAGSPGCRLPTVGGNYRCLSPALQASRTSFPTGPPAVPLLCWVPPTSRPLPMPVLLPGVPSPCLYLMENSHLQSLTQEPAMPRSCPGLALPSPSIRFFLSSTTFYLNDSSLYSCLSSPPGGGSQKA